MGYLISWVIEDDLSDGCRNPREIYQRCECCHRLMHLTIGCGNRFRTVCDPCSKRWRRRTRARYLKGVWGMARPKFLTLTLRKSRLKGGIEPRLVSLWSMRRELFRRLRRAGYAVGSWCGVVEPPNHIHLVMDSGWVPKSVISDWWNEITGDSFIVDIRSIDVHGDPKQAVSYLTSYLSKASNYDGVNLDLLEGFHLIGSHRLAKGSAPPPICLCGVPGSMHPYDRTAWWAEEEMLENMDPGRRELLFGIWAS